MMMMVRSATGDGYIADGLELLQFRAGWKAKILKVHTSALTLEFNK